MNYVIFAINSGFSFIVLSACILSIVFTFLGQASPFAFMGGVFFLPIPLVALWLEWGGTIRRKREYLKALGVLQLVFCGLVVFAFAANALEAIQKWNETTGDFLIWSALVCAPLSAYNAFSGIYRLKLYARTEHGGAADGSPSCGTP